MGFIDPHAGAAASVYLALYTMLCCLCSYVVYKKGLKSTYTILIIFCLIRMGAQLCAVAFSKLGYEKYEWLVAYLVLGAEGYFTLILASFYFMSYAELITFGRSTLRPTKEQIERECTTEKQKRYAKWFSPAAQFHFWMIPANALVIAGGTQLSGTEPTDADYKDKYNTSKGIRSAGQAMFLGLLIYVGCVNLWLIFKKHVRIYISVATLIAWFPLFIRGIFGLLSCFVDDLNYFDFSNYTATGMTRKFIVCEYVLGTTMEFIGALLLVSTYFIKNPYKHSLKQEQELDRNDSNSYPLNKNEGQNETVSAV